MKHHKFHMTTIKHHKDGSHTVTHHHEDGEKHDKSYAVGHHDAMMDGMMDHTSAPNPGEAAADAGDHGVPAAVAGPAGLPPAAAPAA
jgi:hypothetical protein